MRASLPPLMNRYPVPVRRGLAYQLVELFDVSRLTVREAVKALRSKGVVRIEQGRGTFVNPPSHWSPLDPDLLMARAAPAEGTRELAMKLTEARVLVEVGVAGLAARRRTRADLTELKRALDRMRRASDRDDVDGFTEADLEFHGIIMAAAGNPFVTALFEPLVNDDGLVGVGEVRMVNKTETLLACLGELAPRYVIGSDPFDIERLAWNIERAEYGRASEISQSALAAFDIACWDLMGQSLGVPVWKL